MWSYPTDRIFPLPVIPLVTAAAQYNPALNLGLHCNILSNNIFTKFRRMKDKLVCLLGSRITVECNVKVKKLSNFPRKRCIYYVRRYMCVCLACSPHKRCLLDSGWCGVWRPDVGIPQLSLAADPARLCSLAGRKRWGAPTIKYCFTLLHFLD